MSKDLSGKIKENILHCCNLYVLEYIINESWVDHVTLDT